MSSLVPPMSMVAKVPGHKCPFSSGISWDVFTCPTYVNGGQSPRSQMSLQFWDILGCPYFHEAHGGRLGAHLCDAKIHGELSRHYWWPGMRNDIIRWCKSCITCVHASCQVG